MIVEKGERQQGGCSYRILPGSDRHLDHTSQVDTPAEFGAPYLDATATTWDSRM